MVSTTSWFCCGYKFHISVLTSTSLIFFPFNSVPSSFRIAFLMSLLVANSKVLNKKNKNKPMTHSNLAITTLRHNFWIKMFSCCFVTFTVTMYLYHNYRCTCTPLTVPPNTQVKNTCRKLIAHKHVQATRKTCHGKEYFALHWFSTSMKNLPFTLPLFVGISICHLTSLTRIIFQILIISNSS